MIIGIYGDSYSNFNLEHDRRFGKGSAWFENLGATVVNNHGHAGSSVVRTYRSYIETKHNNDLNIFIISNLERNYFSNLDALFHDIDASWYSNAHTLKNTIDSFNSRKDNHPNTEKIKKIFDSLVCYYEIWKDHETDVLLNKTFAESLLASETNTLFLCADNRMFENSFSLLDLSQWEMQQLGWDEKFTRHNLGYGSVMENKWLSDSRICHLSEENNLILSEKIKSAIVNKQQVVTLNPEDFVVPSKPLDFYIEWRAL